MLINIPVKFHDSRSNTYELRATQLENYKFLLNQGQNLQILNKSTQKYPGAKLHMLSNIPIKFHDSRSNTF
jgi:hypothetical protein